MLPPDFNHYGLLIELIYSLVIVISCLLIYFKTKELYSLTSYKGIKYFRNTFLFFGITYIIRFLLSLHRTLNFDSPPFVPFGVFEISFFVLIYLSSMALIYLVYSIFWKKIDKYWFSKTYIFHIISLAVAFTSLFMKIPFIFLVFQSVLFLLLLIIVYLIYKKSKHKEGYSKLYILYLLIFAFWIISNFLEFVTYFSPIIGLIIYAVYIFLFLMVLFKVLRKLNFKK